MWILWPSQVEAKLTIIGSMAANLFLDTTAVMILKIRPCLPSAITFFKVVFEHVHLTTLPRKISVNLEEAQ